MLFQPLQTAALPAAATWQALLVLAPALAVGLGALASGKNPVRAWRVAHSTTLLALAGAALSLLGGLVAGPAQGLGVRVDAVGSLMLLLVTFVGWVIVRYSQHYLAGEHDEAGYVRALLATLAAVTVVVASNHLLLLAAAWTASSLALHRLLTFYADRAPALNAAHKKFIVGRLADASMLAACALLYISFGTLQIDEMIAAAQTGMPATAQVAIVLVVMAALLKCAQLPFHGWLIQVMEAPTPVSALLHAGVVNLGGFVLIRLAPLVADTSVAMVLLTVAGAFTAVVAALVMTTRISIKVALAWSTCAQMGFMLLQCGLGLWQMAMLHIVAHSLYKAHTFLGAGGVVRQTLTRQLAPASAAPRVPALLGTAVLSLAAVAATAWAFGLRPDQDAALWTMAGVVALALVPMVQPSRHLASWLRPAAAAVGLATVYFSLHALLAGWVAPAAAASTPTALPAFAAGAFLALFALQCLVTTAPHSAMARALYPWIYGGLFLDDRFSRLAFRLLPPPRARGRRDTSAAPGLDTPGASSA